ncbi:MAG: DEAD/DEAH box helicase [Holophagae bacterium]|nr:DEAD/DEAH box helicase [Holophagae bacterium]
MRRIYFLSSSHKYAPAGRSHHKNRQKTEPESGSTKFQSPTSHQTRPHTPEQLDTVAKGAFTELISPLKRAVKDAGYDTPTPIQELAIPHLLNGRDMLGCAQTGTGKTAAFMLPILQYLDEKPRRPIPGKPRVLVLTPTRELAAQIGDSISTYGRYLRVAHAVIFGGVGQQPQVTKLRRGLDVVVATPGRLLDLMQQGHVSLNAIEVFVLDEADRMLDMGFIHDIRKVIAKLPEKRQSLFFSATMAQEVMALAHTLVHDPVEVSVTPEQPTVEKIVQKLLFVDKGNKDELLVSLMNDNHLEKVIVFTRMKHMANKVAVKLNKAGISAAAIHGNKSQTARTQALADFKRGKVRVLVATDIAARGIDVDNISHVINYDLPNEPETYIHRIGRTARAGLGGSAISFCSAEERNYLRSIEDLIRQRVPLDLEHRFHSEFARTATGNDAKPAPKVIRERRPRSTGQARNRPSFHGGRGHSRSR